jgi:glycine cleavage system H protein
MNATRGFRFPENLYYDFASNTWIYPINKMIARIGLTDLGQALVGRAQRVSIDPIHTKVQPGTTLGFVEGTKWTIGVRSPLGGTIYSVNEDLSHTPILINQSPYAGGWLLEISRPRASQLTNLTTGSQVPKLAKLEIERLTLQWEESKCCPGPLSVLRSHPSVARNDETTERIFESIFRENQAGVDL